MNRRLLGRLLLSLALLWSQQAAIAHTFAHLQQSSRAASKSLLQDLNCADCLAHAQLSFALGSASHSIVVEKPVPLRLAVPATSERCIRTVPAFEPRAPPQA